MVCCLLFLQWFSLFEFYKLVNCCCCCLHIPTAINNGIKLNWRYLKVSKPIQLFHNWINQWLYEGEFTNETIEVTTLKKTVYSIHWFHIKYGHFSHPSLNFFRQSKMRPWFSTPVTFDTLWCRTGAVYRKSETSV